MDNIKLISFKRYLVAEYLYKYMYNSLKKNDSLTKYWDYLRLQFMSQWKIAKVEHYTLCKLNRN